MFIVFIVFGVLFGAIAAIITMLTGGSFLLALALYSGVGASAALCLVAIMFIFGRDEIADASHTTIADKDQPLTA